MKLIDAHVHAYPTPESGYTWQRTMGHEPKRSGHSDELATCMSSAAIDRSFVLLWTRAGERHQALLAAGVPDEDARGRVRAEIDELNRWGCRLGSRDERFIPFVGLNVRYIPEGEIAAELDDLVEHGARGVKLIPPSMELYANDPLLWPLYERVAELGLPIVSQSGVGVGARPSADADHYGRPSYWGEVLLAFPTLVVILAHLGHGYEEDVVRLTASHKNLYTDTSLRLSRLGHPGRPSGAELVALIRRIGVDRVLFGTNYPFVEPARYRTALEELPLTNPERELIGFQNAERVLRRPQPVRAS